MCYSLGDIPSFQGNCAISNKLPPTLSIDGIPFNFSHKRYKKVGVVIYISLQLDLGKNLAWPNSLKKGPVSKNSPK
jgi:hypothetical protein